MMQQSQQQGPLKTLLSDRSWKSNYGNFVNGSTRRSNAPAKNNGVVGNQGKERRGGGMLAAKRSTPRSDSGSIGEGGGMLRRGSSNMSIVTGSPSVIGRALGFVRGIVEDALVSKSTTETPVVTSSSSSSSQSFENISFQGPNNLLDGGNEVGGSGSYHSGEVSTAESIELQTPITSSVTSESLEDDDDEDDDGNGGLEGHGAPEGSAGSSTSSSSSHYADNENTSGEYISSKELTSPKGYEFFPDESTDSINHCMKVPQSSPYNLSHVTASDHSFNKKDKNCARIKEVRQNCQPQRKVIGRIPPLQISWANKRIVEDRAHDYDDLFLRLVFCISDVCVLRWELGSAKEFYIPGSVTLKIDCENQNYASFISTFTFVCYTSLIKGAIFDQSEILNFDFFDRDLLRTPHFMVYQEQKFKGLPNVEVEIMPDFSRKIQIGKMEELSFEDVTMLLVSSDLDALNVQSASSSLYVTKSLFEKNYVTKVSELQVKNSTVSLKLREPQEFEQESSIGDLKILDTQHFRDEVKVFSSRVFESEQNVAPILVHRTKDNWSDLCHQRNEALSSRIFESESRFPTLNVEASAADESYANKIMYSNQKQCLDFLETGQNLIDVINEEELKPRVSEVFEKSTIDELASLYPDDESDVFFSEKGRICLGENSSFSIMYANKAFQPSILDSEPVRELIQNTAQLTDICTEDGDHAFCKEEKASEKATVLEIEFQQCMKKIKKHASRNSYHDMSLSMDQNESVAGAEKGRQVVESPNRSFCFTSTPAQSAGSSVSGSKATKLPNNTKIPRLPQLRTTQISSISGDKSTLQGFPPRTGSNKPAITPRSAKTSVRTPRTLPASTMGTGGRDSKIPRPAIPSGGDSNSFRSALNIPSTNSRVSDRSTPSLMTTYSSSLHHKPPPTPKSHRPSLTRRSPQTQTSNKKPALPSSKHIIANTTKSVPKVASKVSSSTATVFDDAAVTVFIERTRVKLKGNKDAQEELSRLFNESLNSSMNLRDNTLSPLQLAKVLSKFDPTISEFSLREKQKLASKLITSKDQKMDFKTFVSLYAK